MGYETRTIWYIDPQNVTGTASDSNSGVTANQALLTAAQWTRLNENLTITQQVSINFLSAGSSSDYLIHQGPVTSSGSIIIDGASAATQLTTGTVSNYQNVVVNTSRHIVTWTGGNWTSYVGKRCRITATAGSTPINTVFWVLAVDSGDSQIAYISQPFTTSDRTLTAGDTFVIENLARAPQIMLSLINSRAGFVAARINNLDLTNSLGFQSDGRGQINTQWCDLGNTALCYVTAGVVLGCRSGSTFIRAKDYCNFFGHAFFGLLTVQGVGVCQLADHCYFQGSAARVLVEQNCYFIVHESTSAWDWSVNFIRVRDNANVRFDAPLWGSSSVANSYGIKIYNGVVASYSGINLPSLSGTEAFDIELGGVQFVWGDFPLGTQANGAGLVIEL